MEIFERISKRGKSKDRILFVLESKKGRKAKSKNRIQGGNGREASMPENGINNKRRGENT